jgi:hypothetical protein
MNDVDVKDNEQVAKYIDTSKRLIENALGDGDSQRLLDIKFLMDTVTQLEQNGKNILYANTKCPICGNVFFVNVDESLIK